MKYIIKSTIRKPVTNLINLLGLSVSLALVIILSVYCYSKLITDHFHKNGDQVFLYFRIHCGIYTPARLNEQTGGSILGIESTVRVCEAWEPPVFQPGENDPVTSDILLGDDGFFRFFTYKVIAGNLETALKEPMSLVITQPLSGKLLGSENTIGRIVKYDNDRPLMVKAVVEILHRNSVFSFSAVTSIATRKIVHPNPGEFTEWGWYNYQTFMLLKTGVKPDDVSKSILTVIPENEEKTRHMGHREKGKLNWVNRLVWKETKIKKPDINTFNFF